MTGSTSEFLIKDHHILVILYGFRRLSQLHSREQYSLFCFCFCFYFSLQHNALSWWPWEWALETSSCGSITDLGPRVCAPKCVIERVCAQATLPMGCSQPKTEAAGTRRETHSWETRDSLHSIFLYDLIRNYFFQFIVLANQYLLIW